MSLNLHPQCLARLSEAIAVALSEVTVEHDMFINHRSAMSIFDAESVLPQNGEIRDAMQRYVSESPVFDFVYETLSRELYETQTYDSEKPITRLTELDGYGDVQTVATRLAGEFSSLPWQYSLVIPLPGKIGRIFAKATGNYPISDFMRLVTPDDAFSAEYPLVSGIEKRDRGLFGGLRGLGGWGSQAATLMGLMQGYEAPKWDTETAHLQIYVKGFIGKYGAMTPAEDAVDYAKALFGIAIALRLLKVKKSFSRMQSKAEFYVHRKREDKWVIERTLELDTPQSDAFRSCPSRPRRDTEQRGRTTELG